MKLKNAMALGLASVLAVGLTACGSSADTSAAVNSRNAPVSSDGSSASGPMASRFRYRTGAPRNASIRLT